MASLQAVVESGGAAILQDPQRFQQALTVLESGEPYCSDHALVELPVLWRFVEQVPPPASRCSFNYDLPGSQDHHSCRSNPCSSLFCPNILDLGTCLTESTLMVWVMGTTCTKVVSCVCMDENYLH